MGMYDRFSKVFLDTVKSYNLEDITNKEKKQVQLKDKLEQAFKEIKTIKSRIGEIITSMISSKCCIKEIHSDSIELFIKTVSESDYSNCDPSVNSVVVDIQDSFKEFVMKIKSIYSDLEELKHVTSELEEYSTLANPIRIPDIWVEDNPLDHVIEGKNLDRLAAECVRSCNRTALYYDDIAVSFCVYINPDYLVGKLNTDPFKQILVSIERKSTFEI